MSIPSTVNRSLPVTLRADRNGRSGTAALEFVLVLPVLMLIVACAADLGRAIHYENVLANAARVGAGYGATHSLTDYIRGNWESRVRAKVSEEAANLRNFDASQLRVGITVVESAGGPRRIQVEVAYPFEPLVGWPGLRDQLEIRRSMTMQAYR